MLGVKVFVIKLYGDKIFMITSTTDLGHTLAGMLKREPGFRPATEPMATLYARYIPQNFRSDVNARTAEIRKAIIAEAGFILYKPG